MGLPVTLLNAPAATEVIVAEMGARRAGDVALLCRIARPEVVVVTNVGVAHLEVFGSWEKIVEASAEPVDALRSDGVAVLNADDPVVVGYAERCAGRVVTFGVSAEADVRARDVALDADGRASFTLAHERERVPGVPGGPGRAHGLERPGGDRGGRGARRPARGGGGRAGRRDRLPLADGDLHDTPAACAS